MCDIPLFCIHGFENGLQFGSKSPKGMINKPYAHAGLAAGEAQTGRLSDEKCYISVFLQRFVKT